MEKAAGLGARLVHRITALSPLSGFAVLAQAVGGLVLLMAVPAFCRPAGRPWVGLLAVGLVLLGVLHAWRGTESQRWVAVEAGYAFMLIGVCTIFAPDGRIVVGETASLGLAATFPAVRLRPRAALAAACVAAVEAILLMSGCGLTGAALPGLATAMGALPLVPTLILLSYRRQLEVALAHLRQAATTDALTDLANRRGLAERAPIIFSHAQRSGALVAVLIVDVDLFKRYNDTFGHLRGDQVLRTVSRLIRDSVRPVDVVARLGGEELCVVGVLERAEHLADLAERIRRTVQDGADGVTVSVGGAARPALSGDVDAELWSLMDEADALLYQAKRTGRNRVCTRILASAR